MRILEFLALCALLVSCARQSAVGLDAAKAVLADTGSVDIVSSCASAASMPEDPSLAGVGGVTFEDLDVDAARAVCEVAFAREPNDPHVAFHLSRVMRKQHDSRWESLLIKSADAGLPIAALVLGRDMAGSTFALPQGSWGTDYVKARRYLELAIASGIYGAVLDVMPFVWLGVDGSSPRFDEAERLLALLEQTDKLGAKNARIWGWSLHRLRLTEALAIAESNLSEVAGMRVTDVSGRLATLVDTKARILLELGRWDDAETAERDAIRLGREAGEQDVCSSLQLGLILYRANRLASSKAVWDEVKLYLKTPIVRRATLAQCPEFFHGPFAIALSEG